MKPINYGYIKSISLLDFIEGIEADISSLVVRSWNLWSLSRKLDLFIDLVEKVKEL